MEQLQEKRKRNERCLIVCLCRYVDAFRDVGAEAASTCRVGVFFPGGCAELGLVCVCVWGWWGRLRLASGVLSYSWDSRGLGRVCGRS